MIPRWPRRARRGAAAASLALVAVVALVSPAGAHALPQSSSPSAGSTLSTAPQKVTITFGERPDAKLSTISVLDSSGASVTSGPTAASSADPLTLEVPLGPLVGGVYTVSWRTVSAVDGHRAAGSFAFGLGITPVSSAHSSPGAEDTTSTGPSAAAVASRWVLYVGLLALLGLSFFGAVVARLSQPLGRRLLAGAWVVAALGTVAVIANQLIEAGVDPGQVFATSFGPQIVERTIPLLIAGVALITGARTTARSRTVLTIVALAAAGALAADVLSSHAAAGLSPVFDVGVQFVHVAAVGLWIGGLVGLLVTLRRRQPDESTARMARRFSWIATAGIAIVAVSGLLRAISELGTIDALFSTDFGRLLIGKTALLAGLAGLGAINHFRSVPAAGRVLKGLRRIGSVEVVTAATVILLSATLVNVAPPASAAAAGSTPAPSPALTPLVVTGNDFGTSVRLSLEISPGLTGFNTFTATVTDYDSGAPVAASGVTLRFSIPARSDVGSSRLDLTPGSTPGVFSATGGNLSLDGLWKVTATVASGTASVEVPLTVLAQTTRQPVDVNRVTGIPTIYTVHLSAGRTVQVYLDPDQPGKNDFHVTFFDAAGAELPATDITGTVTTASTAPQSLTFRTLEPGHVVATLNVDNAPHLFAIAATAPGGDQLHAQLVITPGS